MKVKVRGKFWNLVFTAKGLPENTRGLCDPPTAKNKTIRIEPGQTPLLELDTIIHELIHAGLWDLDEEAVEELATDITVILDRLGYRRISDD